MTKYMESGSSVFLGSDLDMKVLDKLPVATYMVAVSMERGFYLSRVEDFTLPKKLYGTTRQVASRILETYKDRPNTTGVLLNGTKGSGKSLAMKQVSVEGLKQGISTIIVGSAYCGEGFNKFISSITEEAILIFDEFEKVYDKDQQNQLLTLFDGIFSTKKLFILTVNDRYSVNEYMQNRPGRIYYNIRYNGLESAFIREYCEDRLEDQSYMESILAYSGLFTDFNFDMLQALVEELNRYKETVAQALEVLNIKHTGSLPTYNIEYFTSKGEKVPEKNIGPKVTRRLLTDEVFTYSIKRDPANKDIDPSSDWFEEDQDEFEDLFSKFTVATAGAHVSKNEDLSVITIVTEHHRIVFTKQTEAPTTYYGVF